MVSFSVTQMATLFVMEGQVSS